MKRTFRLFWIAIVVFSCQSEQFHLKSDLESANLRGKVSKIEKTLHETNGKCACPAGMKTECNKSKFIYDQRGNLLVSYTIDENDSINDSIKYVYNRKGICTEMDYYKGGKLIGKEIPVLKSGKITGYKTYNENGENETTCEYVYSGDEISAEKTFNSNNEIVSSMEKELVNGQIVSQTEKDAGGYVKSVTRFTRNSSNDITEYVISGTKDSTEYVIKFEYEYDNSGNWIKKTQIYNGQIVNIVMRNIEYFNM